jgi:monoamine oxidase
MRDDDRATSIGDAIERPVERVVVVGAGIAGLAAANALGQAGIEAVVIEARGRIGGRLHTVDLGGSPVDLGGSWIHTPIGNPMTAWVDQAGVERRPANIFEEAVGWDPLEGRLGASEFDQLVELTYERFPAERERLVAELGADASVFTAIDRFVSERLRTRLGSVAGGRLRSLLTTYAESDSSGSTTEVALRDFPASGLAYGGDDLGDMLVGGFRRLLDVLASGVDVRLGRQVVGVREGSDGIGVFLAGGDIERGSHALITVPLGVLKAETIEFDPPLPAPRRAAIERLGFGRFEKVALRFDRAFWTHAGLPHVIQLPHDGRRSIPAILGLDRFLDEPVIVAVAFGSRAGVLSDVSTREAVDTVLGLLAQATGQAVPAPTAAIRTRWTGDPFTRGAYAFVRRGSSPDDLEELGRPIRGRLLFAGEATGHARVGYADGALTSGIREAKRLIGEPVDQIGTTREGLLSTGDR